MKKPKGVRLDDTKARVFFQFINSNQNLLKFLETYLY